MLCPIRIFRSFVYGWPTTWDQFYHRFAATQGIMLEHNPNGARVDELRISPLPIFWAMEGGQGELWDVLEQIDWPNLVRPTPHRDLCTHLHIYMYTSSPTLYRHPPTIESAFPPPTQSPSHSPHGCFRCISIDAYVPTALGEM